MNAQLSRHSNLKRVATMAGKRAKYRNVPTEVDGIKFASKLEAKRYAELKLLEMAGEIKDLAVHTSWLLLVEGFDIGRYVDDFQYIDTRTKRLVVEDTKGIITPDCRIKLKLMKAIHGIDVQIVRQA